MYYSCLDVSELVAICKLRSYMLLTSAYKDKSIEAIVMEQEKGYAIIRNLKLQLMLLFQLISIQIRM